MFQRIWISPMADLLNSPAKKILPVPSTIKLSSLIIDKVRTILHNFP
ncbi:MAG: hypothetical protein R2801_04305 [Chitinophagales bacterium]